MNVSDSSSARDTAVVVAANMVALLVCLVAAILVFVLKLFRLVSYRLALYQVLSGAAFAFVGTLKIVFIGGNNSSDAYVRLCVAVGWFTMYCQWSKLMFTCWLTLHVFCFGVLHRNLSRLEALYVVTSLLVPALVASVPALTHTYGLSPLGGCFVYVQNDSRGAALVERFVLWDGPAMVALLAASTAMVVMVAVLARIVCRRRKYAPMVAAEDDQFWKALRQLLPLAAFPILFFAFVLPVFAVHVQLSLGDQSSQLGRPLTLTAALFLVLWSLTSGLVLIAHVTLVTCLSRSRPSATARLNEVTDTYGT